MQFLKQERNSNVAVNPQDALAMFKRGMSKAQIGTALKVSREKVAELLAAAIRNSKKD